MKLSSVLRSVGLRRAVIESDEPKVERLVQQVTDAVLLDRLINQVLLGTDQSDTALRILTLLQKRKAEIRPRSTEDSAPSKPLGVRFEDDLVRRLRKLPVVSADAVFLECEAWASGCLANDYRHRAAVETVRAIWLLRGHNPPIIEQAEERLEVHGPYSGQGRTQKSFVWRVGEDEFVTWNYDDGG